MFKNRSIQVKLVEDQKLLPAPTEESVDVEALVTTVTAGLGLLMLSYVGADTLRQVIVHTAKAKIK